MNLDRYSEGDKKVIEEYFQVLRDGRKTGTVSRGILEREVAYWEKFSTDVVIEALRIHITKYSSLRESYTRGIMRNLEAQGFQRRTVTNTKSIQTKQEIFSKEKEDELEIRFVSAMTNYENAETEEERKKWKKVIDDTERELQQIRGER